MQQIRAAVNAFKLKHFSWLHKGGKLTFFALFFSLLCLYLPCQMLRNGAVVFGVCIQICLIQIYVSALCFQFLFLIVLCVLIMSLIHS
jgi:hypothetical protein